MVRHDSQVVIQRPHTRDFSEEARHALGLAVTRAREASGHQWRPSFASTAGVSVRSLQKLETGEPVGPSVYEAVARTLGLNLERWDEATPLAILDGKPPPANVRSSDQAEPANERQPDLEEFLGGVIEYLRKQGVSHEAIMRAVAEVIEQSDTERDSNDHATQ